MKFCCGVIIAWLLCYSGGCTGSTGKVGEPIAEHYQGQLVQLKVGESTPEDLQRIFQGTKVSLKEKRAEGGHLVETWEVFQQGKLDIPHLAVWGQRNYDKSQSLLFRFEDGRLVSQESIVHEDR